jgi:colanic acid biosynthesis glycosyl transferase WcaI
MEEILMSQALEKKLNILVVSQYFWPENFRINDLVSELSHRGHKVTVLTGKPNYPDGFIFKEYKENPHKFDNYNNSQIIRVPLIPRGNNSFYMLLNYLSFVVSACLVGIWKLRKIKVDVIFVFEPSPITVGIPAALFRKLKKAPITFWVLDIWPETLEAIGIVKSRKILKLVGFLVSWIYSKCDLILAQSLGFIEYIHKYAKNKDNIVYFPSWSDTPAEVNQSPAPEVEVQDGVFNILFAGNIGDAQDFPSILNAASLLKDRDDIRWLIVGDGRQAKWVSEEIKRLNLNSRVKMLGKFPLERMSSFYVHADALLVSLKNKPIFSITIPGKVQSYLATGIPILGMLNGEGADVIRRTESGLACEAGNSEGLAKNILVLLSLSKFERKKMGLNGIHASSNEFSREQLITKLEKWLFSLTQPREDK